MAKSNLWPFVIFPANPFSGWLLPKNDVRPNPWYPPTRSPRLHPVPALLLVWARGSSHHELPLWQSTGGGKTRYWRSGVSTGPKPWVRMNQMNHYLSRDSGNQHFQKDREATDKGELAAGRLGKLALGSQGIPFKSLLVRIEK